MLWLSLCLVTGGSMQRSFTDFVILCCLLFVLIVQTNNILNNCRALGFAYFASLTASPEQCGEPEGTTKPVAQERLRLAASNSMPGSFNFGLNHKVLNNKSEPNDRFTWPVRLWGRRKGGSGSAVRLDNSNHVLGFPRRSTNWATRLT